MVDEPIHGDSDSEYRRLVIPYLSRSGVVDLRYRCIREHDCSEDGCPKYLGRPGASPRIYNVGSLVAAGGAICVTEGELDTLILDQLGFDAVGIPGVNNWKPHWSRLFEDFNRILVFGDGDEAGRRFNKEWSNRFPQAVEMISMPDGMDVNATLLKYGSEWFDDIIR